MDKNLIDTALGKKPADLVLLNGDLTNVNTKEIYRAGVAIIDKKIAAVGDVNYCIGRNTKVMDVKEKYLVPGLIDGHIHIESTMLTMTRFAEAVLPHGTTAVMTDLHEIEIVAGINGVRELLKEAHETPLKVFLTVFFRIPQAPGLETVGFEIKPQDIKEMLERPDAVSLSEVGPHPIFAGEKDVYECIDYTLSQRKVVDGVLCGQKGRAISAAAAAGLMDDHEAWTTDEALDRIRSGIRLMMREGTNLFTKNLGDCLKVITQHELDARHCCMITDDVDALDLLEKGHMDHLVRRAIEEGVDPVTAIQMASINVAEQYRVDDKIGSISPGRYADILVVNNLEDFNMEKVIVNGKVIAESGKVIVPLKSPRYSSNLTNTVKLSRKLTADDFSVKVEKEVKEVEVLVMKVTDRYLPSITEKVRLKVENGLVQPDIERDILTIGVAERYGKGGGVGVGFISGFGLKEGAIASTVCHDYHNILVVGTNPTCMAFAANYLTKMGGGQVAVSNGKVLDFLRLPVGGIMTDLDVKTLSNKIRSLNKTTNAMGCPFARPFLSLSYIPSIQIYLAIPGVHGISDKGFINSMEGKIVSPILEKRKSTNKN